MKNNPKISIIILTFNSGKYIFDCLKSVYKSSYQNYEVIVVDNGSKDKSVDLVKNNFHDVKLVLNEKNLGFTGGNNIGVKHVTGEIVFLLNDDTVIDKDLLKNLVRELVSSDNIGVIGPKIFYMPASPAGRDEPKKIWFGGGMINWVKGKGYHLKSNKKQEVDYITGCALMTRKSIIDKIGLFDNKFFAYWEDADFCQRVKKLGFKIIYLPYGGVWHAKSVTSSLVYMKDIKGNYPKMLWRYLKFGWLLKWKNYRNRFVFFMRHASSKHKIGFLIKFIFVFTPQFLWLITGQVLISLIKIFKKHV